MARRPGRRTILGVLVFLTVVVAGWAGLRARWQPTWRREARERVAAGDWREADAALGRWLSEEPGSAEAHYWNGRREAGEGRLAEAVAELERARIRGAGRVERDLLQALIAVGAGRAAEADAALTRAFVEQEAPDRQVDEALARTCLETFDLSRAATVLDRWARDFPNDPKPHLWRAEVHGRTGGDPAVVQDDYRRALRRDPTLAKARLGLAESLRQVHRNAEAAAEYANYLAAVPNDAAAHLGAGRNLRELGDETGAARHLERAESLEPRNAEIVRERAAGLSGRGDWPGSLALLDRAIALDPFDVTSRHQRGLILARLGRSVEARADQAAAARLRSEHEHLQAARAKLVEAPGDREAQLDVARWMFGHGHGAEGARWAARILQETFDDPDANRLLADYHQGRGELGLASFYQIHARPDPVPKARPGDAASGTAGEPGATPEKERPRTPHGGTG